MNIWCRVKNNDEVEFKKKKLTIKSLSALKFFEILGFEPSELYFI